MPFVWCWIHRLGVTNQWGATATVTVWVAVLTPLDAVMVNVAVVEAVADKRCAGIGVSVKAPVVVLTDTLGELVL